MLVNFLNHLLLEKIANKRSINSRTLYFRDKLLNSSLYWEPTLARDSAYLTVQFAAIRELKLCFKKWYKMYYYLSLSRFCSSWGFERMYNWGHGLLKFLYLYLLILYVALNLFFPAELFLAHGNLRIIATSTFLRFEKITKRPYFKSNKFCPLFARFLQVEDPKV